ncbi:uncharacterized protein [Amphiura filiformis]|uniref:uncharacterized protein n=1 Tax=Amphiura filiformis TaxID=82378 RepID=UPI003B228E4F
MASSEELQYFDIEFHETLGQGGFGKVSRVTFKKPYKGYTEAVAKNVVDSNLQEYEILCKLNHPNIIKVLGKLTNGPINLIFFEYAIFGSLHDYLMQDPSAPTPEDLLRKWAKESALALQYLHNREILHRDLNVKNCLLFDEALLLKLTDFGLSCEINHSQTISNIMGTAPYLAPEIRNGHQGAVYSIYSDIYTYGMLLLEICTKQSPFAGLNQQQITAALGSTFGYKPRIPEECPGDLKDLILECLNQMKEERPTIKEVLLITDPIPKPPNCEDDDDLVLEKVVVPQQNGRDIHLHKMACFPNGDIFAEHEGIWSIISLKGRIKQVLNKSTEENQGETTEGASQSKKVKLTNQEDANQESPEKETTRGCVSYAAITHDGHIIVNKDSQSKKVSVFKKEGAFVSSFLTGPADMNIHSIIMGIAIDKAGKILIGDKERQIITIHDCPSGQLIDTISTKANPIGYGTVFAVNSKDQILYPTSLARKGWPLMVIDRSGNEVLQIIPRIGRFKVELTGIACDDKDNIFLGIWPDMRGIRRPFKIRPTDCHIHNYGSNGAFLRCIHNTMHYPRDLSILSNGMLVANCQFSFWVFSARKDNDDLASEHSVPHIKPEASDPAAWWNEISSHAISQQAQQPSRFGNPSTSYQRPRYPVNQTYFGNQFRSFGGSNLGFTYGGSTYGGPPYF